MSYIKLSFFILVLSYTLTVQAQQTITFSAMGLPDSTLITLGRQEFDQVYREDSVLLTKARPTITLKRTNPDGMYILMAKELDWVALILTDNQPVTVQLVKDSLSQQVQITGSEETQTYRVHIADLKTYYERMASVKAQFEWFQKMGMRDRKAYEDLNAEYKGAVDTIRMIQDKAIASNPTRFWAKMLNAQLLPMLPPDLMANARTPEGNQAGMLWLKGHFWVNYDFTDKRLIQTSTFAHKLDQWLQIHQQSAQQLTNGIDELMAMLKPHQRYRDYTMIKLIEKYEQPDIYDGDRVFVHIADTHFKKVGDGSTNEASFERIKYKADAFRNTLNGLAAPEIELQDTLGKPIKLSEVKAKYTVVYFFSPLCDKCQVATPQVYQIWNAYKDKGVAVFSVTLDDAPDNWKQYVAKNLQGWSAAHSTINPHPIEKQYAVPNLPCLYLLDEEKKIMAKRFSTEKLQEILHELTTPRQ